MSPKDMRARFEEMIQKDPRDLHTRKIFADWLEEYGQGVQDDDLALHHRTWTLEKQEAKEWLEDLASKSGETCLNYSEVWRQYFAATRDLRHTVPEESQRMTQLGDEAHKQENWLPITYDLLIQAGHDFIERGDYFVQQGEETLRSLMWDEETRQQFWQCWSLLTGVEVTEDKTDENPFSCSC